MDVCISICNDSRCSIQVLTTTNKSYLHVRIISKTCTYSSCSSKQIFICL